jgi:hypothetical protein
MPHDKCPVCSEPKDSPTAWSFTCGYHLNSENGCKNAGRIAIERAARIAELEKELEDARKILKAFNTMMVHSLEETNTRLADAMIACNHFFCTYPGKPFIIQG